MDNVDLWIAGLLEDLVPGARVGPTFQFLLLEQFSRTRHGDRFWFENPDTMTAARQENELKMTKLIIYKIIVMAWYIEFVSAYLTLKRMLSEI